MSTGRDDDRHQSDLPQTLDRSHCASTLLTNTVPAGLVLGWAHDNLDFTNTSTSPHQPETVAPYVQNFRQLFRCQQQTPVVGRRSDRQDVPPALPPEMQLRVTCE